ncbi:MAG: hypothetical protein M1812_002223 [Candelaria pacifica]|nr:MAG: hypothetical protein M1812_002223 [Candelaria pacifica]
MASTRRPPPMQIFQDPIIPFDHSHIPSSLTTSSPFRTVPNPSPDQKIVFDPPVSIPSGQSPLKPSTKSNTPPKALFNGQVNGVSLPPPRPKNFITDSPRKKPAFSTFHTSVSQKPQKALFTTFSSSWPPDKENEVPTSLYNDNYAEFPDPAYAYKGPLKRTLLEAAPLKDRQYKKPRIEEAEPFQLPEPEDMPRVDDDGAKPAYSYATLIGMSILRAPNRRLTLAQIYKWISDTFAYYRVSETGWQNSIRHNLSLNKAFVKQERPKDDPGKGNYWALASGTEHQFVKDKPIRRQVSLTTPCVSSLLPKDGSKGLNQHLLCTTSVPKDSASAAEIRPLSDSIPSSDATIPASDPLSHDDEPEQIIHMPPPSAGVQQSSPLQDIHSSPPIARHVSHRNATPPPAPCIPTSSHSRSRKRKISAMNDSGYFSSIESSAVRPPNTAGLLPFESDADRPRVKRGRAEEEIARIRSSSHDSPSKGRASIRQPTPQLVSSSPLHHYDSSLMLPPLTPATTFKIPPKAPASVSPNTNLRNHRDRIKALVGSPVRGVGLLSDELPWSPAFKIEEEEPYIFSDNFRSGFDVFADNAGNALPATIRGSPEKRPARRPRLDRASTTANVLADITDSNKSNKKQPLTPALNVPFFQPADMQGSPSKFSGLDASMLTTPQEDLFDIDFFTDDSAGFSGVDILKGFQKIGGDIKEERETTHNAPRRPGPGGRSLTSRF